MGFFDIEHKNKCPQCGKEMDFLYGKLMCSACGYKVEFKADIKDEKSVPNMKELPPKISKVEEKINSASESLQNNTLEVKQHNNRATFENEYRQYNTNPTNSTRKKISGTVVAVITVTVTLVIIILLSVLGIMIQKFSSSFEQLVSMEIDSQLSELPAIVESIESVEVVPDDYKEQVAESVGVIEYPVLETQSVGMIEFVETVFGKDYDKVTSEEFASIVYMDFYYNDYSMPAVAYSMLTEAEPEWGEYFEVSLESFDYYDTDFSVFPSLHTLYLDDYVDVGSMSGLGELCVLGTFMTPDEIAQYINPEQIISLTLYDMFNAPNLEGIGRFGNLSSLYMNAESVENIDALVMMTGLQNLGIYYGDMIMDFQALNYLTAMESLTITSYNLDDFSFVAYMPNLYSLSIGDCYYAEEDAWNYIAFAFGLQYLTLDNCYVPYGIEKFLALPNMEYLDITECMAGIDMENLSYNEYLWSLDTTGTTFLKVKNGVWNEESEVIYIEDYVERFQEYYPNLTDIYYE